LPDELFTKACVVIAIIQIWFKNT